MSDMTSDPIRLLDDPTHGALLRGDLGIAAQAEIAGLDAASGLAGLKAAVAAEAGTTGALVPLAATGWSTTSKVVVASLLLLGGAGLWFGLSGAKSTGADVERVEPPVVSTVEAIQAPSPASPPMERAAVPTVPPRPNAAAVVPDEPELEAAAATEPVVTEAPRARHRAKGTADAPAISTEDAMAEANLVSRAKKALPESPNQALRLVAEAKRKFPRGMLVEERQALAVQALVGLGRVDEAQRQGQRFLSKHGRGPHAAAVRAALDTL